MVGKLPCTNGKCKGRLKRTTVLRGSRKFIIIKASDLYVALGGGGLPEERERCTSVNVKSMMVGERIKSVHVEPGPSHRSFLHSITLESGNELHLGVSTKGPTVYKVTQRAKHGH